MRVRYCLSIGIQMLTFQANFRKWRVLIVNLEGAFNPAAHFQPVLFFSVPEMQKAAD